MAYVKTVWADDVTPLSAANLNNLETQYENAMADLTILPYNWVQIATTTLAAAAAEVNFADIPVTYRALLLLGEQLCSDNAASQNLAIRFNSDTGSNYYGVLGATEIVQTALLRGTGANGTVGLLNAVIYQHVAAQQKFYRAQQVGGGGAVNGIVWNETTNRISAIRLYAAANNIGIGSKFTLWGAE